MLVLARRLKTATERDNFLARGFVFAEPGAVARLTSNSLACPYDRVFDYFRDVYRFTRFGVMKKLERGRLYGGILLLQVRLSRLANITIAFYGPLTISCIA